jgi:hypothetical protein
MDEGYDQDVGRRHAVDETVTIDEDFAKRLIAMLGDDPAAIRELSERFRRPVTLRDERRGVTR